MTDHRCPNLAVRQAIAIQAAARRAAGRSRR